MIPLQIDVPADGSLDRWVIYILCLVIVVVIPAMAKILKGLYEQRLKDKDDFISLLVKEKNEAVAYEREQKEKSQTILNNLLGELAMKIEILE